MKEDDLIPLSSVVKEALWGGDQLKSYLHLDTKFENVSEVWAISAIKNNESIVLEGNYKFYTLSQLYEENPKIFGYYPQKDFPILLKFIDTNKDLSIQVHPNDLYAKAHGLSSGKEEMWYIIKTDEFAKILIHHDFSSKTDLMNAIRDNTLLKHLNYEFTYPGETYYISPGTIHAIGAGNLLYEAQQSVDVTFRLYDYDRLDSNGNKRDLHINEAIDVIDYVRDLDIHIAHVDKAQHTSHLFAEHFTTTIIEILEQEEINIDGYFHTFGVLKGECVINNHKAITGNHFIVPNNIKKLKIIGTCIIAICNPI